MANDLEWWSESLGRIELQIAREDAEELADHESNLDRLLWIACGDISEEVFMRESEEE